MVCTGGKSWCLSLHLLKILIYSVNISPYLLCVFSIFTCLKQIPSSNIIKRNNIEWFNCRVQYVTTQETSCWCNPMDLLLCAAWSTLSETQFFPWPEASGVGLRHSCGWWNSNCRKSNACLMLLLEKWASEGSMNTQDKVKSSEVFCLV